MLYHASTGIHDTNYPAIYNRPDDYQNPSISIYNIINVITA